MAEQQQRGSLWMFTLALVLSLVAIGAGVYPIVAQQNWVLLSAGALGLVVTLAAWAVSCHIGSAGQKARESWEQFSTTFTDRMEQFSVMLNVITEQQLLSERAKTVAFRDKDRETLQRAIREEIARGQYDAALLLVDEVESTFGYKQDADLLRQEISNQREGVIRRVVNDAAAAIDRACTSEKWEEAMDIANRVSLAYPTYETAVALPQQVQQRKEMVKQQLLARWQDAVARKDVDGSVELLRQLDMYVTPQEVEQLKDGALELFKARIERLRERFREDVRVKRWNDALAVSHDIMQDFPTSKLAQEVRDMMETLKAKAQEESASVAANT